MTWLVLAAGFLLAVPVATAAGGRDGSGRSESGRARHADNLLHGQQRHRSRLDGISHKKDQGESGDSQDGGKADNQDEGTSDGNRDEGKSDNDDDSDGRREAPPACTGTASIALKACMNEVRDDFYTTLGDCLNRTNVDDGKACAMEAKQAAREAAQECRDQLAARKEVCAALGEAPYDPVIDPDQFVDPLAIGDTVEPNPFFPMVPGTQTVFMNEVDGETTTDSVTRETVEIQGVTCIVLNDVVADSDTGEPLEITDDYYAQDLDGNVWYFGETSQTLEDGFLVSLEGSWMAGRDGARAGIQMEANPMVGDIYRMEFLLGEAEDMAQVMNLAGDESVPAASCDGGCLMTKEFSPLEPGIFENKFYLPGVGVILEFAPDTGARVELMAVTSF
ncbi:MAG: hypothetical protein ACE5ID_11780 [Acidobacteriota bacterium]